MTKSCYICKQIKDIDNFYTLRNGKIHSYCKQCDTERNRNRHRNTKEELVNIKGGKCVLCGYSKCVKAMHFHHIDPLIKDFSFGKILDINQSVLDEIDKCILVCSNCHSEIHSGETTIPAGLAKR